MKNTECVAFLQWALPQRDMRWPGFRKVRRQVCRRIGRRLCELGLPDVAAYRAYLEQNTAEWHVLDSACRITISRFYRDRNVFESLQNAVLPVLARAAIERGASELSCLSVGCASGEEAYSLKLLWEFQLARVHTALELRVSAIDSHPKMLERARRGCYQAGSLEDLPEAWRRSAFEPSDSVYCLRRQFRNGVCFTHGDVRHTLPAGPFDLVLCRNLVFTYFVESLQRKILGHLHARMHEAAALVVGIHESLPEHCIGFRPWDAVRCTYRRIQGP
ncbi:MAG: chemotaxis protein CheR [Gammaproteobacteria bacterium]|jgi:chemotaxis protein methyltransferase CheR|nr:chemotaxis protein CheR [Gammaproteobacteria bacterium]NCF83229.1 chemotaxis protein CheR [Pseudomonadota bacterium]